MAAIAAKSGVVLERCVVDVMTVDPQILVAGSATLPMRRASYIPLERR